MSLKDDIFLPKDTVLPNHVALICDGNRRWARARQLSEMEGHHRGYQAIVDIGRACRNLGIHTFTVWGFSTENWSRENEEIKDLMYIMERAIDQHLKDAKKEQVRFIHLGRKDRIPPKLAQKIAKAEEETKNNTKFVFNVAIDYGGKDEIIRATKRIVEDNVRPADINEKLFASYLDTADQPYPYVDLLIRTSAEQRLSGFLPWQMEYAELWFEENPLPSFTRERFMEALLDYSRRRRRFGGSDEIRKFNFEPKVIAKFELDWWRAQKLEDRGGFSRAFVGYLKEQFGVSLSIASEATDIFLKALLKGETEGDWKGTKRILGRFYNFIRRNVKLAFEPQLLASLEVDYLRGTNGGKFAKMRLFDIARQLYAELFRIPILQANKIAHLRILAQDLSEQAESATGHKKETLLKNAEDYLVRSYEALKERVA